MSPSQELREHALYGDLRKHPNIPKGLMHDDVLTHSMNEGEYLIDMSDEEFGMFCTLVAAALENP